MRRRGLDTCRACRSDFVHPIDWREQGEQHWWMRLRCGDCHAQYEAVALDDAANGFDAKLDRDQFLIERAADRLHEEWRSAEADAFAMAMEHGAITADDFACRP